MLMIDRALGSFMPLVSRRKFYRCSLIVLSRLSGELKLGRYMLVIELVLDGILNPIEV